MMCRKASRASAGVVFFGPRARHASPPHSRKYLRSSGTARSYSETFPLISSLPISIREPQW